MALTGEQLDALRKTRDMLREETEQLLAQEAERFENAELTWSTLVRHGQPADEILKAAGVGHGDHQSASGV